MSLPVVLKPTARREFDKAFDWYEEQKPGLGEELAAEVQNVLDRIAETPEIHAKVLREVRRAVVSVFPYCVYYQVEPDRIVVFAIVHGKRDPKVWQSRVK